MGSVRGTVRKSAERSHSLRRPLGPPTPSLWGGVSPSWPHPPAKPHQTAKPAELLPSNQTEPARSVTPPQPRSVICPRRLQPPARAQRGSYLTHPGGHPAQAPAGSRGRRPRDPAPPSPHSSGARAAQAAQTHPPPPPRAALPRPSPVPRPESEDKNGGPQSGSQTPSRGVGGGNYSSQHASQKAVPVRWLWAQGITVSGRSISTSGQAAAGMALQDSIAQNAKLPLSAGGKGGFRPGARWVL